MARPLTSWLPMASDGAPPASGPALPKTPVLDWWSLAPRSGDDRWLAASCVDSLPHRVMATSGRAALYLALASLNAAKGSRVLVPTYHCPSMIAPITRAGLIPVFYGIQTDGQPRLESIVLAASERPVAMLAAHFFGLPLSLAAARAWCDVNGVALIEDCAHCFFGQAGARPVGHWGDYAIASLTKFFPLPEAGLLVSATHAVGSHRLQPPGWRAELKGFADVLELASQHGRLAGVNRLLKLAFAAKKRLRRRLGRPAIDPPTPDGTGEIDCDMGRQCERPLLASRVLYRIVGRERIFRRRRENFGAYAAALAGAAGMRLLRPTIPDSAAPYVFPVLVDDAERVYQAMRLAGMPVFRWDRVWPQTPTLPDDCAPLWRQHVLQLLCHQDLSMSDIDTVCRMLRKLLPAAGSPAPLATPA